MGCCARNDGAGPPPTMSASNMESGHPPGRQRVDCCPFPVTRGWPHTTFSQGLVSCLLGWHPWQMTMLILARDEHFAWLLGEAPPPDSLREAPGGVEQRRVVRWLRAVSAQLEAAGCPGSWLIVDECEVVGLCAFKGPPYAAGSAEIGYGIAETRRRIGHATKAVRLVCEEVGRAGGVRALRAETAIDNPSSQRVLEHNGFVQIGARHDPEDGDLLLWSKPLGAAAGDPPSAPEADIENDR